MKQTLFLFVAALLCVSCSKNEYFGPVYLNDGDTTTAADSLRLLIGCEGNFQYSNASLVVYDLSSGESHNNAFKKANGFELGDVLQSIHVNGDSVFLVVNNSGVVRIVDSRTLKQVGAIEGLTSPRHIHVTKGKRLVVTDIYSNEVQVYDLASLALLKSIPLDGWAERMFDMEDGRLLIANIEHRSLAVMEIDQFAINKSVPLGFIPLFMMPSEAGVLIVAGNRSDENNKAVVKAIDRKNLVPQDSLLLDETLISASVYNGELYVLTGKTVYVFDAATFEPVKQWSHTAQTPYNMYINPLSGDLFLADAGDYLSNGRVYRYTLGGVEQAAIETGIIPQAMITVD